MSLLNVRPIPNSATSWEGTNPVAETPVILVRVASSGRQRRRHGRDDPSRYAKSFLH